MATVVTHRFGPRRGTGLALAGALLGAVASIAQAVAPLAAPWLRLEEPMYGARLSPRGRYLAFLPSTDGPGLNMLDLTSRRVFRVSAHHVGPSFFWSPDGARLLYRELEGDTAGKPTTRLAAYDAHSHKRYLVAEFAGTGSGHLVLDPKDRRMQLLVGEKILSFRLDVPEANLAPWQTASTNHLGKWLATPAGMLWSSLSGTVLRRVEDDGSGLESFDISPRGDAVAWTTRAGKIYLSEFGGPPSDLGWGKDPRWHPFEDTLIYAAGRMVGNKVANYDLRIRTRDGHQRFVTTTQFSNERAPVWHPTGRLLFYTLEQSTDLFALELRP